MVTSAESIATRPSLEYSLCVGLTRSITKTGFHQLSAHESDEPVEPVEPVEINGPIGSARECPTKNHVSAIRACINRHRQVSGYRSTMIEDQRLAEAHVMYRK